MTIKGWIYSLRKITGIPDSNYAQRQQIVLHYQDLSDPQTPQRIIHFGFFFSLCFGGGSNAATIA